MESFTSQNPNRRAHIKKKSGTEKINCPAPALQSVIRRARIKLLPR